MSRHIIAGVLSFAAVCSAQLSGKTVSPELVGFNLLYWIDDQQHFESGALMEQISAIQPGLLRYPAGTASQNYDWRSNQVINPRLFPFDATNQLLETGSYIRILKQTGAKGFVVVDIASAHLKDREKAVNKGQPGYQVARPVPDAEEQAMVDKAVEWAKLFHSQGVSPVYELGNEHYLAFLDYMVFTPEMYAARCKKFIKAIRSVDPDAEFAVCGPDPFYRSHYYYENTPWWPVVLQKIAGDIDRIVLHKYWDPGEIDRHPGAPYGRFRRDLYDWGVKEGVAVSHIKIGFTEWGGRGHMDDRTFGLFCFRALCSFAENGVDYAIEWPFRWGESGEFSGTQLIVRKEEGKRFAFHTISAWNRFFSGRSMVEMKLDLPEGVGWFAVEDEEKRKNLALINSLDRSVSVVIPAGFSPCVAVDADGAAPVGTVTELKPFSIVILQSN